jgi:mono/diheme cytochrome c family protein
LALTVILWLVLVGCGGIETVDGPEIYASQCARCHGGDGQGGSGPALDADSRLPALSDEEVTGAIAMGRRGMPRFSGLSDVQMNNLLAHLRSLS